MTTLDYFYRLKTEMAQVERTFHDYVPEELHEQMVDVLTDIEDDIENLAPHTADDFEFNIYKLIHLNTDDLYANTVYSPDIETFIDTAEQAIEFLREGV